MTNVETRISLTNHLLRGTILENNVYRANVLKTLSVKPAKLGLKYASRNTNRTNIMHAAIGLATEAGELVEGLTPYILGAERLSEKMKVNAFEEMGDLGYYMMVLAKTLKVKLPTSSKKVRLKGMTRSAAILEILRLSMVAANMAKKVFYGPVMTEAERGESTTDSEEGADTKKHEVIDTDKTAALYAEREAKITEAMNEFVPLYWALCYDLFEVPPSYVFVANIAKLSKRYGEGIFQLSEAEERDTDEEQSTVAEAVPA
jgi:hypothetical protein